MNLRRVLTSIEGCIDALINLEQISSKESFRDQDLSLKKTAFWNILLEKQKELSIQLKKR